MAAVGDAIEAALDNDQLQTAWDLAKAWFKTASGKGPKLSHLDFEEIHREQTNLDTATPSPGEPIPVHFGYAICD